MKNIMPTIAVAISLLSTQQANAQSMTGNTSGGELLCLTGDIYDSLSGAYAANDMRLAASIEAMGACIYAWPGVEYRIIDLNFFSASKIVLYADGSPTIMFGSPFSWGKQNALSYDMPHKAGAE